MATYSWVTNLRKLIAKYHTSCKHCPNGITIGSTIYWKPRYYLCNACGLANREIMMRRWYKEHKCDCNGPKCPGTVLLRKTLDKGPDKRRTTKEEKQRIREQAKQREQERKLEKKLRRLAFQCENLVF